MAGVTLLIRKIPNNTNAEDIKKFVKTGVPWRFRLFLKITRITVLTVIDKLSMETELQCLVTIEPDAMRDKIIKRLHAKHLKGRRVFVKPYYQRNPTNDRRKQAELEVHSLDKRIHDRRRYEQLMLGSERTKAFTRKLI